MQKDGLKRVCVYFHLPATLGYTEKAVSFPSSGCLMKRIGLNYMDVSSSVLSQIESVNLLDRYGHLARYPSLVISA